MRAKALSINPGRANDIEDELNEWLSKAGHIRIDEVVTAGNPGFPGVLIIFYSDATTPTGKPAVVCAQCRKKPPANGLKTCEECQKYQSDYRKKRKEESKARYP